MKSFLIAFPGLVLAVISASGEEPSEIAANAPAPEPTAYAGLAAPFEIETVTEIRLHDETRAKDLPVCAVFPKGEGNGPFPVIVFSHGAGGSGDMGFPVVEAWAARGYVVLCPTHADSIKLKRASGESSDAGGLRSLLGDSIGDDDSNVNRPKDVSFLLDSLDAVEEKIPALAGKLDRTRIGAGGHSFGAYTAQVAGGATVRFEGDESPRSLADPRVKAVLQFSGQGKGQQGLHEHSWDAMTLPMMSVTGSLDRAAQGQPPEWRRDPFAHAPEGGKYHLFIEGAHHGSFTGKMVDGGERRKGLGERFQNLSEDQREALRERLRTRRAEADNDAEAEAETETGVEPGEAESRAGDFGKGLGSGASQADIYDWVRQSTTAFWDAHLKDDPAARAWLRSDSLGTLSENRAKLEWR